MDVTLGLNPFDWPARPFLIFYAGLMALCLCLVLLLRRSLEPGADRQPGVALSVPEMAWLCGGWRRAADTVLLGLIAHGAATIDANRHHVSVAAAGVRLPDWLRPFRQLDGLGTRRRWHAAVRPVLEPVGEALIDRGLVPARAELWYLRGATLLLTALPVAVAYEKILLGQARGRPTGILTMLMAAAAIGGLFLLVATPLRTRAGRVVMRNAREMYARVRRAPMQAEVALAFALVGVGALAGTPFASFAHVMSPPGSGGCSGSGDSGCGGGGGGGGGGCGGCSS